MGIPTASVGEKWAFPTDRFGRSTGRWRIPIACMQLGRMTTVSSISLLFARQLATTIPTGRERGEREAGDDLRLSALRDSSDPRLEVRS
jgi:hypothetical protein